MRRTLGVPAALSLWSPESKTRTAVLAALATREPQTCAELSAHVGVTTLGALLLEMIRHGQLVRSRYGRQTYYYARHGVILRRFLPERPNGEPRRRKKQESRTYSSRDWPVGAVGDLAPREIERRYQAALKAIRAAPQQRATE